jgi:nicotinate dehydrogenase subunit B
MATTDQANAALIITDSPQWDGGAGSSPELVATLLLMDRLADVTVFSGKVEYGQGIRSGFTLAVADELDVPITSVQVVLGDTELVPPDRGTNGSASTRTVGLQLRRASAAARQILIGLAAKRLEVPPEQLATNDGYVFQTDQQDQMLSYADLLRDQEIRMSIPEETSTKNPEDFRIMGRDIQRTDALARVTGRARYAQDIVIPGMLFGKVLRPPSYGAHLQQVESTRAERVPGFVKLVREDDFVGVISEREDMAVYALESIRARWQEKEDSSSDLDLPTLLKDKTIQSAVLRDEGSLSVGFDQADHVLECRYFAPYVANAAMEPSAAVASWDGGNLTVWCGDRNPFGIQRQLAQAFGLEIEKVRVIAPEVGGAFGSKGAAEAAYDSARLARAAGRPVRVAYSRPEEFVWSTVRPAAVMEIRSGFKDDGTIVAWEYTAYHAGESAFRGQRGADTPYNIPNVRVSVANSESPLRSGSYRSLGGALNHYAREVHLDEIAAMLQQDPLELRLANLTHPRLQRVLTKAAEEFGWHSRRSAGSVGIGIAIGYDVGSYVAECVELNVEGREIQVNQVVAAFDCGLVLNPDGVRNQIEGSVMMGLGTALWEAVEFDGGRPLNPSFGRYRVPRITDAPQIDVVLVGDSTTPSSGAGEPGIVPIAAAISNAVYSATGVRARELPIVPHLP